jgi:hypothetical protein
MVHYSSEGFVLHHNIFQKCSGPHSYMSFYQERTAAVVATMTYYQAQSGVISLKEFLLCTKLDIAPVSTM